MTMNITGRKARLLATTVAVSLLAIASPANADSSNGAFGAAWELTEEGPGAPNAVQPTYTLEQQIAFQKNLYASQEILSAIDQDTLDAFNALGNVTGQNAAALGDAALAASNLAAAQAAKAGADAAAAAALGQKSTAAAALATANAAATAAGLALAALDPDVPAEAAQIAAAQLAVAKAAAAVELADIAAGYYDEAYVNAVGAQAGALGAFTGAIEADADAKSAVLTTTAAKTVAQAALDAELLTDTGFKAALALWNAQTGSSYTASAAGIAAIQASAALTEPAVVTYASNGFDRAVGLLAAAAASTNANIALASGALTDSPAALEVGANFETEVLGALVNHEGRITANTTAITALDVRTTANTTAIANEVTARVAADNALGGRITAETSARIAADNVLRDQVASSTATAIAMGGAALLPDMGFTLSGNVAFYEGAQAIALNAAAKISTNAFLTASVGGGLNKNGSVGGRVGFVFGF